MIGQMSWQKGRRRPSLLWIQVCSRILTSCGEMLKPHVAFFQSRLHGDLLHHRCPISCAFQLRRRSAMRRLLSDGSAHAHAACRARASRMLIAVPIHGSNAGKGSDARAVCVGERIACHIVWGDLRNGHHGSMMQQSMAIICG